MVKHVPVDHTYPKMNKDENLLVVVNMTYKLAAQKENILLLHEIYSFANFIPKTCALEAILMIGPFLVN
jgi:hypothetical protein